jgi:hypothetical protein
MIDAWRHWKEKNRGFVTFFINVFHVFQNHEEVGVSADGPASAPPSGAATTTPPAGAIDTIMYTINIGITSLHIIVSIILRESYG